MIAYQARMLPNVDYKKIQKNFSFSLVDLEHGAMQDCCDFLEGLKTALIKERLMQVPELLVAHLCAYLGTAVTVHTVTEAEKLEPFIIDLIKNEANAAHQQFNRFPINSTIKSHEQKKQNVEKIRQTSPGSIVAQTMRLGSVVMEILEELKDHRQDHFKRINPPEQKDLFCSQEMLIKIMLYISGKKCAEWREQLDGLSDHYPINQLAIQIGWLIGYFSHLDNKSPNETQYFDYGLPVFSMYREHIFKLMESFATAKFEQEAVEEAAEAETLLGEIRALSQKTHAQVRPPFNDFQKQIAIANAGIEKTLIELMAKKYSIKIMLMSLFYFWYVLEAPLYAADPKSINGEDSFLHMTAIIDIVKNTAKSLPKPQLTPEIKAFNEKMQQLKSHLPDPETLDREVPENLEQQTADINTTIHSLTSELLEQDIHLEAITIALFNHWMRLSVFFGVSESAWQKMDYYFSDIMEAVRNYLTTVNR